MKLRETMSAMAVAMIILSSLSLTACFSSDFWKYSDWLTVNQREVTDAAMQRLCDGIARRDADAVKAEFRYVDICDLPDFEQSVQKLFDYITGDNLTFKRTSSGSDGAAMGGYPKSREFGGVNYEISTDTNTYKVNFDYYSFYSDRAKNYFEDEVNLEKMGFYCFDIINAKNDRPTTDRLYSGCPEGKPGINFDYKTIYIYDFTEGETFACEKVYCDVCENVEPILINGRSALESFYEIHKDTYTLEPRPHERGYMQVIEKYDEEYFENQTLLLVSVYNYGGGYAYVPQWLYIGDFVMTSIAPFARDDFDDNNYEYSVNGVIMLIELPEKVPSYLQIKLSLH